MIRIAVLMKQVPATSTLGLDPVTGNLIRTSDTLINPPDERALSMALAVAGNEISVFTMGPAQAADLLRTAACYPVHHLYHLCDSAFAGSDTYATAVILTAALRQFGPFDLILCGNRAVDGETGQVGPEISSLLDLPFLPDAVSLSIQNGTVQAGTQNSREEAVFTCKTPCAVSVSMGAPALRPPSILGMRRAKNAVIETVSAERLSFGQKGRDLSPTRVIRTRPMESAGRKRERITDPDEAIRYLTDLLGKEASHA